MEYPGGIVGIRKLVEQEPTRTNTFETREQWLDAAVEELRKPFSALEYTLPTRIRTCMGYPPQGGNSKRASGSLPSEASTAGNIEVYIRPELSDGFDVLVALVSELVTTLVPPETGYGTEYRKIANAIGLQGVMRAPTTRPDLRGRLNAITESLGPLNHAAVKSDYKRPKRIRKKQKSRSIKATCPVCEGKIWFARSLLKQSGMPLCGKDGQPFVQEESASGDASADSPANDPQVTASVSGENKAESASGEDVPETENASPPPAESDCAPEGASWFARFEDPPSEEVRKLLREMGTYIKQLKRWEGPCSSDTDALRDAVIAAGGHFQIGDRGDPPQHDLID